MIISDVSFFLKKISSLAIIIAKGDSNAAPELKRNVGNLRFCVQQEGKCEDLLRNFFGKGVVSIEGKHIYNDQYNNRKNSDYDHLKSALVQEEWNKW